jgi:hypothetical protein
VPHPRSENKVNQSVLPGIEKIDFSKYDMIMLGGDITYYTSKTAKALDYCDSLFHLGSPNTLWSFGNHDVDNRTLIKKYTGRKSFYMYNRDNITFVVLDTELNANGFKSVYILGEQLQMLKNVCDTISNSKYLIVLHSRLIWMIGNQDFRIRIDSVAESTKQLDTTNFYQEVYPQLQKAKKRGVKVICLGGDKSKINIKYSPEDSITFYATTMAPEFSDSVNNVMILSYNLQSKTISTEYITLAKFDKSNPDKPVSANLNKKDEPILKVWQVSNSKEISIQLQASQQDNITVQIYSINGSLLQTVKLKTNEIKNVQLKNDGIYIIKSIIGNSTYVKKIVLQ